MKMIEKMAEAIADDLEIPVSRCLDTARAVLMAMREATPAMEQAGNNICDGSTVARWVYENMIDAALSE